VRRLTISTTKVDVGDIAGVADGTSIGIAPDVRERLIVARKILDRAAATGQQIYGLNTGLGANIGSSVSDDASAFQRTLVEGRSAGVGDALPDRDVRAVIAARIVMLAQGGSGISPHVLDALVALLNAGVTPIVPRFGSIGAGDLVMLAPIAEVLIGGGRARFDGTVMDGAAALAAAGLEPVSLAPKDGLSLINASSISVGLGALGVVEASHLLARQTETAALTMAGIGANRSILDARINQARPASGQIDAASRLRDLLGPSEQAAKLQDPLSIRCAPSILGALDHAIASARDAIELELNSAGDNPLVLVDDGLVLSTGNFHTPAIALAFETLGLAIAQCAAASAARFVQLTGSGRGGLPKYLSPVGGASAGFVPLQKTVAALMAAIRHKANPVMLDFFAVSEGVEDHAPQTALAVEKCREMIALWRQIVAFELLAAAQAVDLQASCILLPELRRVHDVVRSVSAALSQDRPLGRDVQALCDSLRRPRD
jgi:histidine ammonia-lyase